MILSSRACWGVTLYLADRAPALPNRFGSLPFDVPAEKATVPDPADDLFSQIVIYVFARVVLALARLSLDPKPNPMASLIPVKARESIQANAWPAFASLSWAFVMYLFRWHPEAIQSSLRSSMTYMYVLILLPPKVLLTWAFLPQLLRL